MGQFAFLTIAVVLLFAQTGLAGKMKQSQALVDAARRNEYRDFIDITRSLSEIQVEMALNELSLQELNVIDALIGANIAAEMASEVADMDEDKIKQIVDIGKTMVNDDRLERSEPSYPSFPDRVLNKNDSELAQKYIHELELFKEHSDDILRLNRERIQSMLRYEVALARMREIDPRYKRSPHKKTTRNHNNAKRCDKRVKRKSAPRVQEDAINVGAF